MTLDLVFIGILLLMVAYGAWRGAVSSGAGLVALLAGYVGALLAATHGSDPVATLLTIPRLVAPAVAGTLGFAVAWLVASTLGDLAIAWDAERIDGGGRGIVDRVLGGAVGLVRGGLVVVLLAVLASWVDAARDLGALDGLGSMPDAGASRAVAVSGDLVEAVVSRALVDAGPAGQMAARITGRPGLALGNVKSVLEDPRLTELFGDRLFWTLITNGSVEYGMNRAAMRSILEDPEMRGKFADLGLVGESARENPDVFRVTMAAVLSEVAPKVHRLQHDPELNEIAKDPEIIALIEAGNMAALAGHPSIRKLVEHVSGP